LYRQLNARRIVVSGIYEVQDLILIADRKRIVVQDPDTDAAEVEGEPAKRQGEMERSSHGCIRATCWIRRNVIHASELKVKDPEKVVGLLGLSVIGSGNGLSGSRLAICVR
jgi:hypothetical protein